MEQVIYGEKKEEKRGETVPEKLTSVVSINCGVNSKKCTPTKRAKVLSSPFGRNLAVGFKNEKKRRIIITVVVIINN